MSSKSSTKPIKASSKPSTATKSISDTSSTVGDPVPTPPLNATNNTTTNKQTSKSTKNKPVKHTESLTKSTTKKSSKFKSVDTTVVAVPPVSLDIIDATINNSSITQQLLQQYNTLKEQIAHESLVYTDNQYTIKQMQQQYVQHTADHQLYQSQFNSKLIELQRIQLQCNNELELYKSKIRHLLSENQNNIIEQKLTNLSTVDSYQQQYNNNTQQQWIDLQSIKHTTKQLEYQYLQLQHSTNTTHESLVLQLRESYEVKGEQGKSMYDYHAKQIRDKYELMSKNDIDELEQSKTLEIDALVLSHKQSFDSIQQYFHDIQSNNMELIKSLKQELKQYKKLELIQSRSLNDVNKQSHDINIPLSSNQQLIQQLEQQVKVYESEIGELRSVNEKISTIEQDNKNMEWKYEILIQKHTQLLSELKSLKSQYTHTVYDSKQKVDFHSLILNKKYSTLTVDLEKTNVALYELITSCGLTTDNVKHSLDYILNIKNQQINTLELQLESERRSFDTICDKYKLLCRKNNIGEHVLKINQLQTAG